MIVVRLSGFVQLSSERTIGRISPDPITEFPQVGGGSTGGECR